MCALRGRGLGRKEHLCALQGCQVSPCVERGELQALEHEP